jgi:hypothetical protein
MGITDRIFDSLRAAIQLGVRVESLGHRLENLAHEVRDLDRRLIRVETALDIATSGRFAALPPGDDEPPRNR